MISTGRQAIGKARALFVFGQGAAAKAVVSTVVVRPRRRAGRHRLMFVGPAAFDRAVIKHLRETVMAVVDGITEQLGLKRRTFQISVTNLGAASAADLELCVEGFSADLPVMLAVLSAALRMPLPQDVVATGHVASVDGDIKPVSNLPAKLAAAVDAPDIQHIVVPVLDSDRSMQALSPTARERADDAIVNAKSHIDVHFVGDVGELLKQILSDEAIVLASLRRDFFEPTQLPDTEGDAVQGVARFLLQNHDARFWRVLEAHLGAGRDAEAKQVLLTRARYQIRRKTYPPGFGSALAQLVLSLPPATRRLRTSFPLLTMDTCLRLARSVAQTDHEDLQLLLDAASGKCVSRTSRREAPVGPDVAKHDAAAAVDAVIAEISADALAEKIGRPIDLGRATYTVPDVTIATQGEFHDTISAFYLAMLRHSGAPQTTAEDGILPAEALALLERAFQDQHGAAAAWAEARDGVHGGMRTVLDTVTEQFKYEQQAKHVSRVLKEALDPLDWDARVAFVEALLHELRPHLPEEIQSQPAERFARHYESIVQAYVHSLDRVKEVLRRL